MYSNGIAGLNAPLAQNDTYPGSYQTPSQYATPSQTPISMSALNASYEPKTDAYSGQMMASGGIAALRYDDGGMTGGEWVNNGEAAPKTESTWTPDQPVKLQTMDQMLAGDTSGKEFKPTEHGYKWDAEYGKFMNPNGSTLGVNLDGSVANATPAFKDYEFNGQYWNPAGENVAWHPETNQSAYKIGGVEVPISRENMKGIAALTDASGKPKMQMDKSGQPIFTEPEGIKQSTLWMDEVGAPLLASAALGGAAAFGSGAIGAGTTMANAGATGAVGAGAGAGAAPGYGISTSATPPGIYSIGTTPTGIGSIGTGALNTGVPASLGITEGSALTGTGIGAGNTAGMNMYQKAALGSLALKGLTSGAGTQGTTTATTQSSSPTYTTTTSTPVAFNPGKNTAFPTTTPIYNTPTMGSNQNTGLAYQPMTFKYYAHGGIADLGGYAAGGKLLKGPGDGMSDSIVANIGGKQPARLADGEFVVPADVVSHLGNGSTDAGAKHLYKMMDNIRKARTGNPKQGKKINADKFLPRN